jgi:beta-glucosidase
MGSAVQPASLAGAVRYVYGVTEVPILVTEHGLGTDDDALRAGFLAPSLRSLLDAVAEGVPVLGYFHWTLLDNFEWVFGYDFHYGLHTVDRQTFSRSPKPSATVYAAIARAHGI